jgi:ribosome biogenesis protein ERB1
VPNLASQVNPYEPEVDWFTRDVEIHPIHDAPEPKRRFAPSKWEEKKCARVASPWLLIT